MSSTLPHMVFNVSPPAASCLSVSCWSTSRSIPQVAPSSSLTRPSSPWPPSSRKTSTSAAPTTPPISPFGLGGATYATNVMQNTELATPVITTVGKEHLAALGGSLQRRSLESSRKGN